MIRFIRSLCLASLVVTGAFAQSKQYIVVVDASASRASSMETQGRQFVADLVKSMNYGDELVLMEMQDQGINGAPVEHRFDLPSAPGSNPTSRQKAAFEGYKRSVGTSVPSFFALAESKKTQHTDILSTMSLVQEKIADGKQRSSTVVFLSDMLQSAKGIEMERGQRMPIAVDYIHRAQANGTLPNLAGACIVVIGADPTTSLGVRVRNFWQVYFQASNGKLLSGNYRVTPPPISGEFCH